MDKGKTFLAATFTILGIVVGAILNNYLTSERETNRDLFSARLYAYNEFMVGQALRNKAKTEEEHGVANEIITKGKFKLAMLGSEETLSSMINYWQADPQFKYDKCPDPELRKLDTKIYQSIRSELVGKEESHIGLNVLVPFLWTCALTN
jgi:hypothetical protein